MISAVFFFCFIKQEPLWLTLVSNWLKVNKMNQIYSNFPALSWDYCQPIILTNFIKVALNFLKRQCFRKLKCSYRKYKVEHEEKVFDSLGPTGIHSCSDVIHKFQLHPGDCGSNGFQLKSHFHLVKSTFMNIIIEIWVFPGDRSVNKSFWLLEQDWPNTPLGMSNILFSRYVHWLVLLYV